MFTKPYTLYVYNGLLPTNFNRLWHTNFDLIASARDVIFPRLDDSLRPYLAPDLACPDIQGELKPKPKLIPVLVGRQTAARQKSCEHQARVLIDVLRETQHTTHHIQNCDHSPTFCVLNAAAITKPQAVEHLAADLSGYEVNVAIITETHLKTKHTDHLWWTSYLLWSNFGHLQSLLLPHQTASLYPSLPWLQHSSHHCHLHCSLQTRLL